MDFLVEKILVPEKKSFQITEHELGSHTSKIHTHCNCELNFIKRGWGRRYVGDNISNFQAGDLVLMGPDLPHCWEVKGTYQEQRHKCIGIQFQEGLIESVFTDVPALEPIRERSAVVAYATNQRILDPGWVELVLLGAFLSNTVFLWLADGLASLQLGGRLMLLALGSLWLYFRWRERLVRRFSGT
jgi:hypothetical protein